MPMFFNNCMPLPFRLTAGRRRVPGPLSAPAWLLLLTLGLPGGVAPASDWPVYHGDPALAGRSDAVLPDEPSLLWTYRTEGDIRASVATANGMVVLASMDGKVYGLALSNGELKWTFDTSSAVEATPCIAGGSVFVGADDGALHALDLKTGAHRWKYETDDRIVGAANWFRHPDDGTLRILVGSYDFLLHCVDGETGKPLWRYETENYINGAPAIAKGRAYFGGCDGIIHGVDLVSGKRVSSVEIGSYIAGSAAIEMPFAYLGHYGNDFICVDLEEGRVQWSYRKQDFPFFASPALGDQLAVIGGRDKMVHGVKKVDGAPVWTFRTKGRVDSSPVIARDRVVVGSEDGRLYILDLETGKERWSYDIGSPVTASPAIAGDTILIGAEDGVLYAFGPPGNNPPPPAPDGYPELTFHAPPGPPAENAVLADWPRFLGPAHAMVSDETPLHKEWGDEGPPLVWERERGESYSSPVIASGRLIWMHRLGDEEVVECLEPETGKRYWEHRYPTAYRDRYGFNGGPRASPVIDADLVVTFGAEGVMHALDLQNGEVRWMRDLNRDYAVEQNFFGVGASPVVYGNWVLVNVGAPGGPCLAALDRRTGETVWGAGAEWAPSYATPVVATIHGRKKVLVFAGGESRPATGGLLCIDLEERALDFRFALRSEKFESVNASSPLVFDDRIFISHSIQGKGAMVRVIPDRRVEEIWRSGELGIYWMTPVAQDGYLYGFDGRHIQDADLVCQEAESGHVAWRSRPAWQETVGDRSLRMIIGRGHLLKVDGAFLCLGEMGHLLWLDLTPERLTILTKCRLFDAQETYAPPVLSHGLLYVTQNVRGAVSRSPMRLLCYDLRGE